MKKLYLLKIFLFACITLNSYSAIQGTIKGKIIDENGLILPGANIYLEDLKMGTASDKDGDYWLPRVPVGTYNMTVTYIGYQKKSIEVKVKAEQTTKRDVALKSGVVMGDEVMVLGDRLKGQAKALNQQKNNQTISNVVSADQIGRFPDSNIGDAVKRIPSIHVDYDQGEARFVNIRGTEARLNSVMINGDRIPSAEGEVRAVQVDLIPSDMVQTIEVSKAITADMDADAIGGTINLVTRATPTGLRISGTLGSGYNMLSEKAQTIGNFIIGNRYLNNKLGVVLSASYFDHNLGSDNSEGAWDQGDSGFYTEEWDIRTYKIRRLRESVAANFDYVINNNHTLYLNTIYNHRNDWENRFRLEYKLDKPDENGISQETEIRRQTKAGIDNDANDNRRLEDQRTSSFSLRGKHVFGQDIKIDWAAGYAKASEERPNERYMTWRVKDVPVRMDLSDPEIPYFYAVNPSDVAIENWSLKEITEEHQYTDEIDTKFKLNIDLPFKKEGDYKNSLKLGGKYKQKEKKRDNNFFEYEPIDEAAFDNMSLIQTVDETKDNFLTGDYKAGRFASAEFVGNLDLNNSKLFEKSAVPAEYAADNYEATETVTAGFLMFKQNMGSNIQLNAGLRIEQTNIDYTGNQFDENTEEVKSIPGENDYTNVLPSLLVKYNLDNNTIIRAAWTNTIARPNYYDLVPYRAISEDFEELEIGNPELKPTTSMNFDLMAEHYLTSIGILSAGIFYKNIEDYIYVQRLKDYVDPVSENTFQDFYKPMNGASAKLFGFECAVQRQLGFLPGFLKYLGIYANYTYTYSEADNPILNEQVEDKDETIKLPGTAPHSLNAALTYQTRKFSSGLQFNYTDAYIDAGEMDLTPGLERYYDTVTYLDLNASYVIMPQLRFFFEANNLLNQPLRYYAGKKTRTYQAEYYNRRFSAGLKFDL